jgi:C4-dicarboxylate-specific signal transduction histidine kinase
VKDAEGNIIGSAVAIQDITPLRIAEEALKEANQTLENRVKERTRELRAALESLELVEEELRIQKNELEASLAKEKALRNQLIQSEKYTALARLIASVAHEIQNPLQTVKNSLYLLEGEVQTAEARGILEMASAESSRMSTLVQQLSETYRPTDFKVVDFELYELLGKVQRLLDPRFRQDHVEWRLLNEPGVIRMHGVPDRIQQVFMNICLNAADAMGENGGQLNVCVTRAGQRVCITFQDSGPGIEPEVVERIFEPFFTTKEKGSGLGLAISYEIIKEHGGEIRVESKLGQGATFKVYLPLTRAA